MDRAVADRDTMYLDGDAHYLSVGLSALAIIDAALGGAEPRNILDLPSGFGRVTRVLRARFPRAAITASDLDPAAINFCAARFGACAALSVRDFTRLRLRERYDLIWVGSLITHLPPPQTRAFFAAMARHMTPRSTLIVSSHGPSTVPRLRQQGYGFTTKVAGDLIAEFERTGFGYRDYAGSEREIQASLTNENYGISVIDPSWLRESLPGCGLRMDAYHEQRWDDHHDIVVARLPRAPPAAAGPGHAAPQRRNQVPELEWNNAVWDGSYDWTTAGEEWSDAWGGSEAQWFGSLYPRLHRVLPAKRVLEIAPGFGRWTKFLIRACDSFVGVDLSAKCVAACQTTFAAAPHATFIQNDGLSLTQATGSFDLVFSFDSLVHAEIDVFMHYIPEIIGKLTPTGVAFLHHSNLLAVADQASNPHCRATSVDAEQLAALIRKHGGRVLIQEIVNWGGHMLSDCLTMFGRADAPGAGIPPTVIKNPRFMDEAEIIRTSQSLYSTGRIEAAAPVDPASLQDKVNQVWSVSPEAKAEALGWYWMAHSMVRERVNTLISGNQWQDAYGRLAAWLAERGETVPLGPSISLGCGFGALERDLARRGMIREIDAYDLAEGAVVEARRLAEQDGLGWIRYHVADLEAQDFAAGHYHAVFAHSSVHHVDRLEALFATVRRALRPGGIFHLNEYVGPTRFQWTEAQLDLINGFLDSLPDRLRQTPNGRKPPVVRPTIEQMVAADPTEAVRSADIRRLLLQYFSIVEERPYGGTLLHMGLAEIAQNFDTADPEAVAHLQRFFELEDTMMANGTIGSDFTVITAIRQ
jgi:SAM-dependent methyltransferase